MYNAKFDLLNNQNEREIIMNEERLDILDKVKKLTMLKGTEYMTTKMVADYYEVQEGTIKASVSRHKEELTKNGYKVLYEKKLKEFKGKLQDVTTINEMKFVSQLALFNKRSILNIGMLLEESSIAEQVRTLLLDNHEQLNNIHKKLENGEEITKEDIDKSNPENNENKKYDESRIYYVYEHIRLDKMEPFYIGKGKGERAYDLYRNDHHDAITDKYGHAVVIIADNLTEEEAYWLERDTIEDYVFNLGYGIDIEGHNNYDHTLPHLTNKNWGGIGGKSGIKQSEETRRKRK